MFEDILIEGLFALLDDPELFFEEFFELYDGGPSGDFIWDSMRLGLL